MFIVDYFTPHFCCIWSDGQYESSEYSNFCVSSLKCSLKATSTSMCICICTSLAFKNSPSTSLFLPGEGFVCNNLAVRGEVAGPVHLLVPLPVHLLAVPLPHHVLQQKVVISSKNWLIWFAITDEDIKSCFQHKSKFSHGISQLSFRGWPIHCSDHFCNIGWLIHIMLDLLISSKYFWGCSFQMVGLSSTHHQRMLKSQRLKTLSKNNPVCFVK